MKTFTYKNVLLRIKDITDLIDIDQNRERLRRLINKAAIECMNVHNMVTKTAVIDVRNGIGELPCDLFRLLRAREVNASTLSEAYEEFRTLAHMEPTNLSQNRKYDKTETHIKPSWMRTGQLAIYYYGIPTVKVEDDEGEECEEIAIDFEQMDYCAYEAARIILRDEAARGKINPQIYALFAQEADERLAAAFNNARKVSIDQMEAVLWMQRNGQFFNGR